jgi:2-dehydro-3-deoxy-D-arabinonate dehydratase
MKLYRTSEGFIAAAGDKFRHLDVKLDELFSFTSIYVAFNAIGRPVEQLPPLLAPIQSQEVWAAGVTYFRSRSARMEESKGAGGGDFYDRVYNADRPELFFKATPHRVVGPGEPIRIRSDSKWNVPEPELTLVVNSSGKIVGYTIGNDVSSRDIEGANPLYLPQAKVYSGSCALGPCILLTDEPLPASTEIKLTIERDGKSEFEGQTTLDQMRRKPQELVDYLFRDNAFPNGCFLMTGTGVIPPDSFTLKSGDQVSIEIPPIGTLVNPVA